MLNGKINGKAQGAVEYLLIIGAAAVVSILVIGTMFIMSSSGQTAANKADIPNLLGELGNVGKVQENCFNGIDDDGDGKIDCADLEDCISDQETGVCSSACADKDNDLWYLQRGGCVNPQEGYGYNDCNDSAPGINPGVSETGEEMCADGIDNDCDNVKDCFDSGCNNTTVCTETCEDGKDNDADGLIDCDDQEDCSTYGCCGVVCDDAFDQDDGGIGDNYYALGTCCYPKQAGHAFGDCDDANPEVNPSIDEGAEASWCHDNVNNNCDLAGLKDCADSQCVGRYPEICGNSIDDDCDGATDCADSDCSGVVTCVSPGHLVGWWKFKEGSGIAVSDESGKGNNGIITNTGGTTLVGAEWVSNGRKSGEYTLRVKSQGSPTAYGWVQASTNSFSFGDSPRTITAWVKNEGTGFMWQGIVAYGNYPSKGFALGKPCDGTRPACPAGQLIAWPVGESYCGCDASFGLPDNEWSFVAITYNYVAYPAQGTMVVKRKSASDTQMQSQVCSVVGTYTCHLNTTQSQYFFMGAGLRGFEETRSFKGQIDDVTVWNTALTDAQIQQVYNIQK
ncbi:MAG: LamG-like jellyroll fold domain-containing protein [archaeon]